MLHIARLVAANIAGKLENGGLQQHNGHGAKPEGRTKQKSHNQNTAFKAEAHRPYGKAGELPAQQDHERIPRTTAQGGMHIQDSAKGQKGLPDKGAYRAGKGVGSLGDERKKVQKHVGKSGNKYGVEDGTNTKLAPAQKIHKYNAYADKECCAAKAHAGYTGYADGEACPGACTCGPGLDAEKIAQAADSKAQHTYKKPL